MAPKLTPPLEHFFRTRLINAVNEPPNFATHYRFAMWGCGSECASGAVIDLATGELIAPPLAPIWVSFSVCQSAYEGFGVEVRVDSKLMILRCGRNFDKQLRRNVPDVYYFVLDGKRFRQLAFSWQSSSLIVQIKCATPTAQGPVEALRSCCLNILGLRALAAFVPGLMLPT